MKKSALVLAFVLLLFVLVPAAHAGHDRHDSGGCFGIGIAVPPIVFGGGYYAPDCGPRYGSPNCYRPRNRCLGRNYCRPPVVIIRREPVYLYPQDNGYYDNGQDQGPTDDEMMPPGLVLGGNGYYYLQGYCYFQDGYYWPYPQYRNDYWYRQNRQWRHHFCRPDNRQNNDRRGYRGQPGRYDGRQNYRQRDQIRRSNQPNRPDGNGQQRNGGTERYQKQKAKPGSNAGRRRYDGNIPFQPGNPRPEDARGRLLLVSDQAGLSDPDRASPER